MKSRPEVKDVRTADCLFRVLQVGKYYAPFSGGIESHLQSLCERLRTRVDLKVLVANESDEEIIEVVNGVRLVRAATRFTFAGAPICRRMTRLIRESGADLVHLHLPNPAAVLAYIASGHRGPLVVSYHSEVVRQRMLRLAFEPILRWVLGRADAIIVATPNHIENSRTLTGFRDRCHVIPYGVGNADFDVEAWEVEDLRQNYGDRIVLSVGRLVYYKGFEHLIDAMPNVNGRLVIVGDGPLRADLESRARARGVADRVDFVGRVERTAPFYHAADVFVLASVAKSEAFGIVQLEAMACGTPVVNTRLDSGVPYVSRDGETGITVPPGDPVALAGALNRLLNDAPLRHAYGSAGRTRVRDDFDECQMSERILKLYEQIISPGLPASRFPSTLRPGVDCAL